MGKQNTMNTLWMLAAVAVILVGGSSIYDRWINPVPSLAGVSTGGGQDINIFTDDKTRALDVVCYDVTGTADMNGVSSVVKVARNGQVIKDSTTTTGAVTYDVNQGFRIGDQLSVRCLNNTDIGYYENRKDLILSETTGVINIPVHAVGTPQVTVYNTAGQIPTQQVALAANGVANIKADIDTSSELAYYYRPILAFKDNSTNGGSIVSELTKITISGGVGDGGVVSCDSYALSGYVRCVQVATDFVSAGSLKTIPIQLTCGSSDCAGVLDWKIVDGVPYESNGVANINLADSYDSGSVTGSITVT